jgi:hypothetical protein
MFISLLCLKGKTKIRSLCSIFELSRSLWVWLLWAVASQWTLRELLLLPVFLEEESQ